MPFVFPMSRLESVLEPVFVCLVGGGFTVLEDEDVTLVLSSAAPVPGASETPLARFEEDPAPRAST